MMEKFDEKYIPFERLVKEIEDVVLDDYSESIIENAGIWKRRFRECIDVFVDDAENEIENRGKCEL